MNKKEYTKVLVDGSMFDFESCVNLMDDEIREGLHETHLGVSEQDFVDQYCALHEEKFNEIFSLN